MKFRSERPALVVHDGQKALARFVDGHYETDDPEVVEALKHTPGVEAIEAPRPKRQKRQPKPPQE